MGCEQLATKADIAAINNKLSSIDKRLDALYFLIEGLKPFISSLLKNLSNELALLRFAILTAIDALKEVIIAYSTDLSRS
jgi:hypothetical protein